MGGKPCIRGMRVTVGAIVIDRVGLFVSGHSPMRIHTWKPQDVREALAYAAWRVEEVELPWGYAPA